MAKQKNEKVSTSINLVGPNDIIAGVDTLVNQDIVGGDVYATRTYKINCILAEYLCAHGIQVERPTPKRKTVQAVVSTVLATETHRKRTKPSCTSVG